ncbi:divergent polysaccharide deacetylase family protein [Paenibacillus sp. M1]|uniref:Divergent polysaccharide deacetylase family protein n=1 Tax=Paenibacillus haidiansis TaxID=1574488 RepID=A0ABU7VR88_9BACL
MRYWKKRSVANRTWVPFCLLLILALVSPASPGGLATVAHASPESNPIPKQNPDKPSVQTERRLAIIIDDFGNAMGGTEDMINLPVKLTVAVMPFMRTTAEDAKRAHERGHDVIVHLPMEPKQGRAEWLGPGAILSKMSDEEVRRKVEEAIDNVPYAAGINNHMGSKITEDKRVMGIILEVCMERGLFFVDSKTNYWSITSELRASKGLPDLNNDIFLDDVHSIRHITGQLRKVQELLDQKGKCVAIGHVGVKGKITAAALQQSIPELKAKGVKFVGISELAREYYIPGTHSRPGFTLP